LCLKIWAIHFRHRLTSVNSLPIFLRDNLACIIKINNKW